ncbi:hypothetical protein [Basfia succiniciproducens]|uniref:Uncharacterized protein n=1 Tax=Basfia succiniciproducens TaxID=653940 RepID=A0A1G5AB11_9PAST|nr:hypothetical protein [Basfia succiniciproducens]QIM68437.1 hypothetical protein A4G13_03050 [Basfia succiniciproducens]SCX75053.1 hypothetical protein SAMN02910354_00082 [Basfia succiniciproducens]
MKATITFYKIDKCGMYDRSNTKLVFLGVKDMLQDLSNWAIGKELAETDVFKKDSSFEENTYLADIQSSVDSTILVTWNQLPYTAAGVLSLPNKAKVGEIRNAYENPLEKDSIPGYPTYFGFIPSLNVFATICFNTTVNGRAAMENYIKHFMKYFSSYIVATFDDSTNTKNIEGYKNISDDEGKIYQYPPSFQSRLYPKEQEIKLLKSRAFEVKKITKKASLTYNNELSKSWYQNIMSFIGMSQSKPAHSEKFSVKTEISINNGMTENEVQELYNNWCQDDQKDLVDYGLSIGDKLFWFSKSIAKDDFELELSFNAQNSFENISKLLSELDKNRKHILSIMNE